MELISVKLPLIRKNDPFLDILTNELKKARQDSCKLKEGDVIVISSKVVATSQGRVVNLADIKDISEKSKKLAEKYEMDERIVELILGESSMIIGGLPTVVLTKINGFLIANAGIDQSNAGPEKVVLLPENLEINVVKYWKYLKSEFNLSKLGVIFADSRVQPLRKGTIGIAVATAGFEPIEDCRGKLDLYGRPLQITQRAVADDLTSAAQFLLGEADEQTPVVIVRGAELTFTDNPTSRPEMPAEECLYMNVFSKYLMKKSEKENTER